MSRKTFLGEYVFVLFLLLPLVASITGCDPAEAETLKNLYKQAIINQDQIPGGCNCRDNCNRSIMAPAASNTCQDETNNVRVTVVYQGIRYSVPVGCYCICSDTSWSGGVSTCVWDNDKFELEAPQYARSAQVVAGVE
jgi:hypothetical protein